MFDFYDDEDDNSIEDDSENVISQDDLRKPKNFLGIMFNCCGVYGRIYKNKEGTAYVGRCPKCLRSIKVPVGDSGTSQRFFTAD